MKTKEKNNFNKIFLIVKSLLTYNCNNYCPYSLKKLEVPMIDNQINIDISIL